MYTYLEFKQRIQKFMVVLDNFKGWSTPPIWALTWCLVQAR